MSSLDDLLVAIGLNEKEAAIYLLMLSTGSSPASALAKRAGIVRSTAQFTCQQLVEKGLAKMSKQGHVQIFTCEPPEKLLYLLARRKREIEEQEDRMNAVMGDLKAMMNPESALPKVHFYEGVEGVRLAHQSILDDLSEGDSMMEYVRPLDRGSDVYGLSPTLDSYINERVRRKIHVRVIMPPCDIADELVRNDKKMVRETRIVRDVPLDCEAVHMLIYKDKVNCLKVTNHHIFAYIVQDKDFTALHKFGFELAWKAAGMAQ